MADASDVSITRCGFVAILGATNAGKSTLVNTLVGTKVTIVSHKVQTTRMPIRGIAIEGRSQLVFIDTPGIFAPKRRLDRAMVDSAWSGAKDADVIAVLVDASRGITEDVERIIEGLPPAGVPLLLVLNKVDLVGAKDKLLALIAELTKHASFQDVFMISATEGDGVNDFKKHLAKTVPEGPWHYPEDDVSDAPMRLLAAEITRERIYKYLHQELPYAITVETSDWKEFKNGSVRIEQTIFVERDGQKRIVLGKNGETIKRISSESRAELTGIVGQTVHLFLFVKVRSGWGSDPERYRELGLEFPKD